MRYTMFAAIIITLVFIGTFLLSWSIVGQLKTEEIRPVNDKLSLSSNSVYLDNSKTAATIAPPAEVTFKYDEPGRGTFVQLHGDGRVTWEGEFDEATLLFWRSVTRMFPDFKKEICKTDKPKDNHKK